MSACVLTAVEHEKLRVAALVGVFIGSVIASTQWR